MLAGGFVWMSPISINESIARTVIVANNSILGIMAVTAPETYTLCGLGGSKQLIKKVKRSRDIGFIIILQSLERHIVGLWLWYKRNKFLRRIGK